MPNTDLVIWQAFLQDVDSWAGRNQTEAHTMVPPLCRSDRPRARRRCTVQLQLNDKPTRMYLLYQLRALLILSFVPIPIYGGLWAHFLSFLLPV